MRVLVVCQAGEGVGLGHLSRCLVVSKMLRTRFEAHVRMLIQSKPFDRADLHSFEHRFIPPNRDLAFEINVELPVDLVLVDLHPQRVPDSLNSIFRALRAAGSKLVAIDGLLNFQPEIDLIFIPSFQFNPPGNLQSGANIVYGWDCFLLDGTRRSHPWKPGREVLALTGGSDATQLGASWPTVLDASLPGDVALNWVTGPFASRPKLPVPGRIKIVEYEQPNGLGTLMQHANYAVTVFGVSFFELLYLGVPTVVFSPYGGKDSSELSTIANAGVALVATDERDATTKLVQLMSDDILATRLSEKAQDTLSVTGAERLGMEIDYLIKNQIKVISD